jgi:diadenosine tetraphosphatase ApaH/serine/threonine PP2A family protein phosphatase
MRYLVLTDIHANLEALGACLTDAGERRYDRTLVLGDLVGYGANPNETIEIVQRLKPRAVIRGNHDKVACGLESAEGFNPAARTAAEWTLKTLTPANRAWLANLAQGPYVVDDLIEICHGSPFDEDTYVFDNLDAFEALQTSARPLCLFGHTHCAVTFELPAGGDRVNGHALASQDGIIRLTAGSKYLVNPGSVGQPRDGDPRAGYAIVDTALRQVELFRLTYPVQQAQAKIIEAGLPEVLGARLAVGR